MEKPPATSAQAGSLTLTPTGAFQSDCCEASNQDEIIIQRKRGDVKEVTMDAEIMAAVENEVDSILADFSAEDGTETVPITIEAATAAAVRVDRRKMKNLLEYKEGSSNAQSESTF